MEQYRESPLTLRTSQIPIGTRFHVQQPYTATKSDELSMNEGDTVLLTEAPDGGWWRVRKDAVVMRAARALTIRLLM